MNVLRRSLLFLLVCAVFFVLIEGVSSTVLIISELTFKSPNKAVAERSHTQYDRELGWVNIPNFYEKNMYADSIWFRTNSQGFRNTEDFSRTVPPGKIRVICSGDSFALGFGVNNDQAWCQRLAALDARLQTVNMGQAGYGVDQMYLWYKRDGLALDHSFHVLGVITEDFRRMGEKRFLGYEKPILRVQNDVLVVGNVPVPKRSAVLPWLTLNKNVFASLRTVQLMRRWTTRQGVEAAGASFAANDRVRQERDVAAHVLSSLDELNRQKNSRFILVYLPTQSDYGSDAESDSWRHFLRAETAGRGILFFDLVEDFQQLPRKQVDKLFIPRGVQYYRAAAGHYSVEGNEYVASELYRRLVALMPEAK